MPRLPAAYGPAGGRNGSIDRGVGGRGVGDPFRRADRGGGGSDHEHRRRPARRPLPAGVGGATTCRSRSRLTCVYICVVPRSAWPSSSCTARRSAPPSRRWVAKVWRSACGWVGTGALVSMIRRTSRGVSGLPRRFGNRNPPAGEGPASDATWQPPPQRRGGRAAERHDPCLAALAHHRGPPPLQIEVVGAEAAQLPHPQAAAVQQLDHGEVAPGQGDVAAGGRRVRRCRGVGPALEQRLEVVLTDHLRQPAGPPLHGQPDRRVGLDPAGAGGPAEVAAHRARLAGDAAPGVAPRGQRGDPAPQCQPLDLGRTVEAEPLRPADEPLEVGPVGGDGRG